ncbi:FAD:protein FMN transferase [Aerococcus kribbianus]|uniref:FAD:protein FMN transferase n=1 Tax=Aerococcus kribbianus TaxID=2999064 RepID=A0A9X3FVS8_9LACT|nr:MULTISPECIES: FAD:protein FMN transferase [unclassified Aerococcus]MCZ0717149.1 FAD:protein FMN transferase [Aerococcus sp. YH-aer221]MCZ0725437.1 FAD:protein FMN transferase [Aerococcus sp. YH-aer222]
METQSRQVRMMGTVIDIQVTADQPQTFLDHVEAMLVDFNARFSAHDDQSQLGRLRAAAGKEWVQVSEDVFDLVAIGKEHSLAQPSFLNIAIGPLASAWRIGFTDAQRPSDQMIQNKLALTDPHAIALDFENHCVFLEKTGMSIDLGALAKGYFADKIMDYLADMQVASALINLGGNLMVMGDPPNRPGGQWRIGIQNPKQKRGINDMVIKIDQGSVVTSGIYERYLQLDGKSYHHIFDPNTGYPVASDLASLTIVSPTSLEGEIWTTRLFGLSIPEIMEKVDQETGIEAIAIDKSGQRFASRQVLNMVDLRV